MTTPTVKTTLSLPEVYEGGSGAPLILLHGFTETWRIWIPILRLLEPHYRVIVPTLPGHSDGLILGEPANPMSIANALVKQLRDRGINKAHVVGQSLGGWMAFEMARHGLARSALGVSPGGGYRDEQLLDQFVRKARTGLKLLNVLIPLMLLFGRIPALRKKILSSEMLHGDRVPYEVFRDKFQRISRMTILQEFVNGDLWHIKPLPEGSKVPLGIVWCEKDTVLPFAYFGQPLLDILGLKTHGVVKNCGHNPMFDNPEGVAQAILDFTRAVERDEKK